MKIDFTDYSCNQSIDTVEKFKIKKPNKYLLIGFVFCCILVAWMAGDLIIHAKTDYRATSSYNGMGFIGCENGLPVIKNIYFGGMKNKLNATINVDAIECE